MKVYEIKDIEQIEMILDVFSDYLKQHSNIDILFSEKFGYIYIALWSAADIVSYDAISIESAEHLCEILMDVMVYDYMAKTGQLCVNREEAKTLYHNGIAPYVVQLLEYQEYFKVSYKKAVEPLVCKNV